LLINIGQGLNDTRFGIEEAQLQQQIGAPDYTEAEHGDRLLFYNELRSVFWFSDSRLHWIQCSHPGSVLFGQTIFRVPKKKVLELVSEMSQNQPDEQRYSSMESVAFDDLCLELQFEFGTLETVCFGNQFDGNDEPIWPKG